MATGTQMSAKEDDQVRDTEIMLSTGKLLGIFFALAIVCGVFFTMGYLLGKSNSAGGKTEIVATVPSSGAGKPYAGNRTPEAVTQTCPPGSPNCAAAAGTTDTSSTAKALTSHPVQPPSGSKTPDQSTTPPAGTDAKAGTASSFMVQVAADRNRKMLKSWLRRCGRNNIRFSSPMQPAILCSTCRLGHSATGKMLRPCALAYLAMVITQL